MSDIHEELMAELRRITKLLCLLATEGKLQKEQIVTLAGVGLHRKEIADLLGTTPNTVSVTLSRMKPGSRARPARNRTQGDERDQP